MLFLQRNFIKFSNFSKFKIFDFFAKPQFRWKRHFYEIIPFAMHSTANLPPLPILKKKFKFSLNKPIVFLLKIKIRTYLRDHKKST